MAYHDEDNEKYKEEVRRYYLQQKSIRSECDYGSKNCSTCKEKDCKIRLYVTNF
jgi:hypothetical protein